MVKWLNFKDERLLQVSRQQYRITEIEKVVRLASSSL